MQLVIWLHGNDDYWTVFRKSSPFSGRCAWIATKVEAMAVSVTVKRGAEQPISDELPEVDMRNRSSTPSVFYLGGI